MIRPYRADDEAALRQFHVEQGHPYPFPDLNHPQFVSVLVATDEHDVPVQAVMARKTVEVFMVGDPAWRTPGWRLAGLRELHEEMHRRLLAQGFTDVHAWLAPAIARGFGRRLCSGFGWIASAWKCYQRQL